MTKRQKQRAALIQSSVGMIRPDARDERQQSAMRWAERVRSQPSHRMTIADFK